jgi:hypothetical protein
MLREHYTSKGASESTLDRVRAIERARSRARLPSRRAVWVAAGGGVVAIGALAAGLLLPYWSGTRDPRRLEDLARAVIEEVRQIHRTSATPELVAADYAALAPMAEHLGFTPRAPRRLTGTALSLTGASLVTIRGRPAARLALVDAEGDVASVFQTIGVELPVSERRDLDQGTYVVLWHEDELLMALVRRAR